jgi:hypothetical protein
MRVTRAVVIAMDREWEHPLKAKGLHKLTQDVHACLGLPLERWPASTDVDPTVPVTSRVLYGKAKKRQESVLDVASMGAIGCATSHIKALRSVPATDDPALWTAVFESDAVLACGRLHALLSGDGAQAVHHPVQPGIIMLNTSDGGLGNKARVPGLKSMHQFTNTFMGTVGYLVRNRDAGGIAAALVPISAHVDGALGIAALTGNIPPIWGTHPMPVSYFNPQLTSIHMDMPMKPLLPYKNLQLGMVIALPWALFVAMAIVLCVLCTGTFQKKRGLST